MLLASLANFTTGLSLHREIIDKCIAFLNLFKDQYDFYVLDFDIFHDWEIINNYNATFAASDIKNYVEEIGRMLPIKNIIKLSLNDECDKINKKKSFESIPALDIPTEDKFDLIFTFNNYIDPGFNWIASQKRLRYKDIQFLSMYKDLKYFDYMVFRYSIFLLLNESFKKTEAEKMELIADPLDLRFDGFKYLLPDIPASVELNNVNYEYFPFYQYYYFVHKKPEIRRKEYSLITGSTLYDKWRREIFEKYLSGIYLREMKNQNYKWYLTGELFGKPHNSFIEPDEFSKEVEKSRYGIVLNTYAKDIISTNKVSNFISRNCVPIICEGSDEKSRFFPEKLLRRIEIKNSDDLFRILSESNYEELNGVIQEEYSYYYNLDYYKNVYSKYF